MKGNFKISILYYGLMPAGYRQPHHKAPEMFFCHSGTPPDLY